VHRRNGCAEYAPADNAENILLSECRNADSSESAGNRDRQRTDRESRIEGHGNTGTEGEHRYEMRAPDRGARGDSGQKHPADALNSGRASSAFEHLHNCKCARGANENRKQDQPGIMLDAYA
jgi:hypothetical protein